MPLSVQRRFECIAPVTQNIEVPCVFGSHQLLLQRSTLYWTARITVVWTVCLVWMRENKILGCTPLRKGISPPYGPRHSFKPAGRVSEIYRKCWQCSIMCIASFYIAAIVCTVQESMITLFLYAFSTEPLSLCMCATHFWYSVFSESVIIMGTSTFSS